MAESMWIAIIGGAISLISSSITSLVEYWKRKNENSIAVFNVKRAQLSQIYEKLHHIINLFPDISPNDIMRDIEGTPNYNMEQFGIVKMILTRQIDDYNQRIENPNIEFSTKKLLEEKIIQRESALERIQKNESDYYKARKAYQEFCLKDKAHLDIYAGQKVKNCLIEFEVTINNVFISGQLAGMQCDPVDNRINVARNKLIDSFHIDLGIV